MTKFNIHAGAWGIAKPGYSFPGELDLTKYVHDVLTDSGIPVYNDCCTKAPVAGDIGKVLTIGASGIVLTTPAGGSSSVTGVSLGTPTGTTNQIVVTGGSNFNLVAATSSNAGLMTATQFTQLSNSVAFTALSGDAVSTSTGGVTTIQPNAITNAKLAQAPTLTIKGNNTGSSANVTDLTATQIKTLLGITAADISGVIAIANGGTAISTYATGDTLYASAANTLSLLHAGTNGQVNTLVNGVPAWVNPTGNVTRGRVQLAGTGTAAGVKLDVKYDILSGTPILSYTLTSGVGTLTVSGGTIDLRRVQANINDSMDVAAGLFTLVLSTLQTSTMFEYPVAELIFTNVAATPSSGNPYTYKNPNTAPALIITGGTAGSSITIQTGAISLGVNEPAASLICSF